MVQAILESPPASGSRGHQRSTVSGSDGGRRGGWRKGWQRKSEDDLVGMIQGVSLGMRDVPPVDRVIVEVVVRVIVVVVPPPIVVPEVVVIVVLH